MSFIRKRGITEVKIKHNRALFWVIIALILIVVGMWIYIRTHPSPMENKTNSSLICSSDADCVPSSCCHADSCENIASKKVCNVLCTQECQPGTLDCGQGSCACVNNKCSAVLNNNGTKR